MQVFGTCQPDILRGSKLSQMQDSAKDKLAVIQVKKKFLTLALAGQRNFYVFWKTILKKR
jgi:hypothetical protein